MVEQQPSKLMTRVRFPSPAPNRQTNVGDELLARMGNYEICKAAFEKAIFVYPNDHLEMEQGARVILKSKEQP